MRAGTCLHFGLYWATMTVKPPKIPGNMEDSSSKVVIPEVLPPADQRFSASQGDAPPLPSWLSRKKLMLAFFIAVVSDALSIGFQLMLPMQLTLDIATALLLFIVLGWRWPLLLGLVMEAIPGVAIFPAWVLVVSAIAALGQARPGLR